MNPIYETRESFDIADSVDEVLAKLEVELGAPGQKVRRENGTIVVETGSNILLRLFGTMLPTGRRSVPAGMTISATPTGTATSVEIHAYDRIGWFVDAKSNAILRERSEANIQSLIGQAKAVLKL